MMRTVISSFVELGLKKHVVEKNKDEPNLEVYETGFERDFLIQTREYYKRESNEFLANNPVVEYLKKVQSRFEEEQRRVLAYLDQSSQEKLEKVLVEVLIKDHIVRLYEEFKVLLQDDKEEDMGRLYQLVKKTENHRSSGDENSILEPIRKIFKVNLELKHDREIFSGSYNRARQAGIRKSEEHCRYRPKALRGYNSDNPLKIPQIVSHCP